MMWLITVLSCGGADRDQPATCGEDEPGERLLRRLTHDEYQRTVADLTGVPVDASFASDPTVEIFRNDAHLLVVDGLLADQYRSTAEAVGEAIDLDAVLPCDPATDGDVDCATSFVQQFGLRAFRRPLTEDDVTAYVELWSTVAADDGFDIGVRWVVTAMLQSPHFLYRSELGVQTDRGVFELTDWEMATALSYLLWGTMPDADLFAAASTGALRTDEQVRSQVDRMIADPRTLDTAWTFVEAWLDLSRLETVARDGLTPELRASMADDTRSTVVGWVAEDATLATIMADGALLTEPSVLTTYARPDGSSPVHRGVLVREHLLCEELPPPPANLDTSPPPVDPTQSTRDRYIEHATNAECAGCHALIDPLGFAFEHYDQLGAWRDDDAGHVIDDSGSVDGIPFEGPAGLASVLLDEVRFRECFVYTWRRHARGTHACGDDLGVDVPFLGPLIDVPLTYGFRHRTGGRRDGDTFAQGEVIDVPPPVVPPSARGVRLTITINNDWGQGYCAEGQVDNETDETVTWTGRSPQEGTIDNIWNAGFVEEGSDWVFSGVDHNATLDPGAQATFGFCAQRG